MIEIENKKIQEKINNKKKKKMFKEYKYILGNIYYDLDGHNIFKREHRYQNKISLLIMFSAVVIYNTIDLGINIYLMIKRPNLDQDSDLKRILTLLLNMINIAVVLVLTTITNVKLKIQTTIYY